MSLKHVVLALVSEEECYGYRLHERVVELSLARFAARDLAGLRRLVDLEEAGLVASRVEESDAGRTRKLYRVTKRGETELRCWLDRPRASGALLRRRILVELAVRRRFRCDRRGQATSLAPRARPAAPDAGDSLRPRASRRDLSRRCCASERALISRSSARDRGPLRAA